MHKRNIFRLLLLSSISLISFQALAEVAFSEQELATIRQYMYNNFASSDKIFKKQEGSGTITSEPGAVIASPSQPTPWFSQDYQFHWTRDAAITMRQVVKEYEAALANHQVSDKLTSKLQNYISFEQKAQLQISYPGEETLGQPKFNIDGTVWEGMWARPQNDGPAIRALAMCELGRFNTDWMRKVYPSIKTDLDYVAREWHQSSFDLWEEVKDTDIFFTKMMQRKALTCGANLFYFVDHVTSQRYTDTAKVIRASLDKHWNEKLGYITETPDQVNFKGGGLNSASILAVLYGNDLNDAQYEPEWSVVDDRVMSTVAALLDTFANEYPINEGRPYREPLIGRYPNDKYDGNHFQQGNPWILATAAMAEYYYSLAYVHYSQRIPFEITKRNHRFYEQLGMPALKAGQKFEYGTGTFQSILVSIIEEGEEYLEKVKQYQYCAADNTCLHFDEQIDAKTGKPTSAKDLTWGYVSILRAMDVRAKL